MRVCSKCGIESECRIRKNRSGILYEINICIKCERLQKNIAERKRYNNLSIDSKKSLFDYCKEKSKTENYKIWRRKYQKDKELNNPSFLLKRRVGALLRNSFNKKGVSSFDILGYTNKQLKIHIESLWESWMNWGNWGVYNCDKWDDNDSSTWTWQIDHIIPVSSFNIINEFCDDFKKCWSLENLRPLSAKENILKGAKDSGINLA